MICEYEVERGLHRAEHLGAAGHRLLMEAIRIKDVPRQLLETKRHEEWKAKQGK
jgi:hypothetical protein